MTDVEKPLRQLIQVADPDGTVTIRWLAGLIEEPLGHETEASPEANGDMTVQ